MSFEVPYETYRLNLQPAHDLTLSIGTVHWPARDHSRLAQRASSACFCCYWYDHRMRGWARYELREYAAALDDARCAIEHRPWSTMAYRLLSSTHAALGRHEDAVAAQEEAVDLDPSNRDSRLTLAARRVAAAYHAGKYHRVVELASEGVGLSQGMRNTQLRPYLHR